MYGKKRSIQQIIDRNGRLIFESALPNSEKFSMIFSWESEDFGIDGHMQVFKNKEHEGEFLKAQLKSKGKAKYINKGQILSYSLDLDSAYFLIKKVKDPAVLIVVDNKNKRVFWYPIQTSVDARVALEQRLLEDNQAENPSITLHVDVKKNILSRMQYQGLYTYLQEAKIQLAREALLNLKTDKTLSAGVKHINEIERKMYELEGFDWAFRKGTVLTPGTVFSIETSDGKSVDYFPNRNYKPELAPRINLRTKFSTKTKDGIEKYEAFRKAVQDGKGSVDLSSEYIDSFEVVIGTQLVDSNKSGGKTSVSIGQSKNRQLVSLNNGESELEHRVDIWAEDGAFIIQSVDGQPLSIRLSLKMGELSAKFTFGVNPDFMANASQHLRMLDFIRNTKELVISVTDHDGFKHKLFGGSINVPSLVTEDQYRFAKALAEIEQTSGTQITFPLPDTLTREDIANVFWVHRILTQGKIVQKITLSFTLQKRPPEHVEKDKYMSMTQTPPEIYLFGRPYIMPGFTQTIAGKITGLETPEGKAKPSYKLEMEEAEISIKKTLG